MQHSSMEGRRMDPEFALTSIRFVGGAEWLQLG